MFLNRGDVASTRQARQKSRYDRLAEYLRQTGRGPAANWLYVQLLPDILMIVAFRIATPLRQFVQGS